MQRTSLFLVGLIVLSFLGAALVAQERSSEQGSRRRDDGGRERWSGGPPPWMQGGPPSGGGRSGGGPPWAQGGGGGGPPWMQRGGGGPGGERGGGSSTDRNERMIQMLRAMDRNGNGKLEQNEIPEYRRSFVSGVVTRLGGDPNKTIDLNDLARRASSRTGTTTTAGASTAANRQGSAGISLPTDPLVPYFGEPESQNTPVLSFGERESAAKTVPVSSSNSTPALSQSDQILRSAREVMNKYDKNKNGTLDKDKGEWVGLPFKPENADKNHDGRLSMTELIDVLGGKSVGSTGAAIVSTKQSDAYDRLPPGVPDWFFERDKDKDGQLTMLEYSNGQPWTEAIADEFAFLDKNNDGYATVTEVFAVLKQVDEEKRLKEEQAQREKDRLRGGAPPTTTETAQAPETGTPLPPGQGPPPPSGSTPASQPSPPAPTPTGTPPTEQTPPAASPPSQIPSTAPYASGSSPTPSDSDERRRSRSSRRR